MPFSSSFPLPPLTHLPPSLDLLRYKLVVRSTCECIAHLSSSSGQLVPILNTIITQVSHQAASCHVVTCYRASASPPDFSLDLNLTPSILEAAVLSLHFNASLQHTSSALLVGIDQLLCPDSFSDTLCLHYLPFFRFGANPTLKPVGSIFSSVHPPLRSTPSISSSYLSSPHRIPQSICTSADNPSK